MKFITTLVVALTMMGTTLSHANANDNAPKAKAACCAMPCCAKCCPNGQCAHCKTCCPVPCCPCCK